MKKPINSSSNSLIFQYNEQQEERISKICSPLKECFDIAYFGYYRILNNGRYFLVSNCPAWIECLCHYDNIYNTEFFKTLPQYFSKFEPTITIWPDNTLDESLQFLKSNKVYNGINIVHENKNTLEGYFFGTEINSPLIRDFYRSRLYVLENFILHFQKISAKLIDTTDVSRLGTSPTMQNNYPLIENIFKNTTPWEEKIIKFNALLNSNIVEEIHEIAKQNLLSPRELQCLSQSSTGMTAKEIARVLGIGYRTVETYLDRIRIKTGCQTKQELTSWFDDKFKHLLLSDK